MGLRKWVKEWLAEKECALARRWTAAAHRRLFNAQWQLPPTPEWFDHAIDLYADWSRTGNSLWLERGAFGSLALKGGSVLELACGDGFNANHFYALRSKSVIACDFDPAPLATAQTKNSASNIQYLLADIRTDMPEGTYENVVWDAAMEHFKPQEIHAIMQAIKHRLTPDGILSGYTLVERGDGKKQLHQHEYEFKSMADLKQFLEPYFTNVRIFETIFPNRHNLYFWASDGPIPFGEGWLHAA